jgi:hypothetical protein
MDFEGYQGLPGTVLLAGLTVTLLAYGIIGSVCKEKASHAGKEERLCCYFADDAAIAQSGYFQSWGGHFEGPGGALARFEDAVRSNPASPYRWCDLAEGFLAAGDAATGQRSIAHAVELGPKLPQILLRAANFEFRTGSEERALHYFARVLAVAPDQDEVVFSSYERMGASTEAVLHEGLPDDRQSALAYFRYLLAGGSVDQTARVWAWMREKSLTDYSATAEYVSFLVAHQMLDAAAAIWAAQLGSREPGYLRSEFLTNGNFVREPSGAPLDWRVVPAAGVQVSRESCDRGPRMRCIKIEFSGSENLEYQQIAQAAVVPPGIYRFTALGRSAGITTDEGVGFRIVDRENSGRLDVRTRQLHGTQGWTDLALDFRVPAGTKLLEVQVYRPKSGGFANRIRGTAWFTDVKLRRLDGGGSR